jgi:IMP cyclohydrolase
MQIFISSQAEYDQLVKTRKHIGNELVIQNNSNFITVRTDVTVGKNGKCKTDDKSAITVTAKENGIVEAEGKTTVIGHDNANVIAKGNCKITLHDSAFGNVYDHCQITLKNFSKISADGSCTVHAHDETSVSAFGSTKVYTYQKATAKGTDVTALSGKGESTLTGQKNCSITAKDNCVVYASENCTVQTADNCLVVANSFAKIKSQDNCLIMSNGKPEITILDKCEHLNLDNVTEKNIMGALKQMAQSKAVTERPYVAIQILKDNIHPARKAAVDRRLNTMGLKDQPATKNYLYSLIEAEPAVKNQTPAIEHQLEAARKAGYVQGVCECVAVVGNEQNMGKKLLSEMNVTKDMAKKFANPETYKTLEKGIFAQKQDQNIEQAQSVKR